MVENDTEIPMTKGGKLCLQQIKDAQQHALENSERDDWSSTRRRGPSNRRAASEL